jgi:hypothetical protein
VKTLREQYYFKYIPNDFFATKPKLPTSPQGLNLQFNFPIKSRETAKELYKKIINQYNVKFPLNKEWVDIPKENTNNKPPLPHSIEEVIKEIGEISLPITKKTNIKQTVKIIGEKYFFQKLPEKWIQLDQLDNTKKPPLPSIQEIKTQQSSLNEIKDLELPITSKQKIIETITKLRNYFTFTQLPKEYLQLPPLPEIGWDCFNTQ